VVEAAEAVEVEPVFCPELKLERVPEEPVPEERDGKFDDPVLDDKIEDEEDGRILSRTDAARTTTVPHTQSSTTVHTVTRISG